RPSDCRKASTARNPDIAAPEHRAEVERQISRGLKPLLAILLQAPRHNFCERGGKCLTRFIQSSRLIPQNRGKRLCRGIAAEWTFPAEHFVQRGSQRKDVRARVDRPAAHLLGRHVADRADNPSRLTLRLDL